MRPTELLRSYARGERNFRDANLRGSDFRGQDLSGADFSGSDIRSTNFEGATLQGAGFLGAKAGVQLHWVLGQLTLLLLLAVLAGYLQGYFGYLVVYYFPRFWDSQYQWSSRAVALIWAYSIVGMTTYIAIAYQGFTLKAISLIGGAFAVAIVGSVIFAGAVEFAVIGAFEFAVAVAIVVVGAFAVASAFAVAGIITVVAVVVVIAVVAVMVAGASTFAGGVAAGAADAVEVAIGIAVAVTILCSALGIHITRQAQRGNPNFFVIRTSGLVLSSLGGTHFYKADLTSANFSQSILKGTNFCDATIDQVYWKDSQHIDRARVGNTILQDLKVQKLLVTLKGYKQSYIDANLSGANLKGVNLEAANLKRANLSRANLQQANLQEACCTESLCIGTDFKGASLTGACLEGWNIDHATCLDGVDCQYVYLLRDHQERRPSSGEFAPGEFTKLFQEVLSTVDLIFRNGMDWKAFAVAFQKVQVQNEDTLLEIQSIENKGDGVVVVRVNVPSKTNKKKIHSEFNRLYKMAVEALEAKYRAELKAQNVQIALYRKQGSSMEETIKLLASRPITLEVNATSNSQSGDIYNGTIKSTNFAPHGVSSGGILNDYSQTIINNLDDIGQLINTLRSQAEQFPQDAYNGILEHLNDLQEDLEHPEHIKPSRLKAPLAAILAILVGLGGAIATATDFSNNVLELGKKFGIELVQPQQPHSAPHSGPKVAKLRNGAI